MSSEEREAHVRRMIAHGQKVAERFKRDNAEFEASCRVFWDFLRRHEVERNQVHNRINT